jgi:Uma2 family endonuclease
LEKRVFEIITDINGEAKILSECITLVEKYEPRVVILQDKSYISLQSNKNAIDIVLYVRLPRGSARKIALTFRKST